MVSSRKTLSKPSETRRNLSEPGGWNQAASIAQSMASASHRPMAERHGAGFDRAAPRDSFVFSFFFLKFIFAVRALETMADSLSLCLLLFLCLFFFLLVLWWLQLLISRTIKETAGQSHDGTVVLLFFFVFFRFFHWRWEKKEGNPESIDQRCDRTVEDRYFDRAPSMVQSKSNRATNKRNSDRIEKILVSESLSTFHLLTMADTRIDGGR